ncbi:MAG: DUF2259 domain-containing protein [Treponema sp.]|nr:DUF2259 domain-containing protein [Treponema sp.]
MKKILISIVLSFTTLLFSFAGDAAAFSDIGFSNDGKVYVFGEYGKIDKKFQAWAEIYAVDIAKNEYVNNEVFVTRPSKATASISGKKAYENLKAKSASALNKYNCTPSDVSNLLYVKEGTSVTNDIRFQDFDGSSEDKEIYYHIKLVPTYKGKGKNVVSKYYISLQMEDENGKALKSWKVGSPDYERKGISSYQIERVFTDKDRSSLVFVIQKTLEDDSGTSIRYMVETLKF